MSHPDLQPLLDRARHAFRAWTGRDPDALTAAPGRVNLIGEHTDYNDGFVLPMAVNRWCVAVGSIALGGGPTGRIRTDDLGRECAYDADTPDKSALASEPWAAYSVGTLWMMRQHALRPPFKGVELHPRRPWAGADILIASSVPLGSGLSSSAAVEVATATLARKLFGIDAGHTDIARAARDAEHVYAGVPCGIMDQLISVCGGIRLIDCRSLQDRPVHFSENNDVAVVVAHSGVKHALGSGEYAKRRVSCERAARALGVPALRDATLNLLSGHVGALSAEDHARARHVITENARVADFAAALGSEDPRGAGRILYASHASLRDDYRVSCPELDTLVEAARATPGVYGSRMTGGGFGGCTITLCAVPAAPQVVDALAAAAPHAPIRPFIASPVSAAAVCPA